MPASQTFLVLYFQAFLVLVKCGKSVDTNQLDNYVTHRHTIYVSIYIYIYIYLYTMFFNFFIEYELLGCYPKHQIQSAGQGGAEADKALDSMECLEMCTIYFGYYIALLRVHSITELMYMPPQSPSLTPITPSHSQSPPLLSHHVHNNF